MSAFRLCKDGAAWRAQVPGALTDIGLFHSVCIALNLLFPKCKQLIVNVGTRADMQRDKPYYTCIKLGRLADGSVVYTVSGDEPMLCPLVHFCEGQSHLLPQTSTFYFQEVEESA